MQAPPGAGPLTVQYQALYELPGVAAPPEIFPHAQIYNWLTGKWRTLPASGERNNAFVHMPLEHAEAKNGLVRFRSQAVAGMYPSPAHLLVTSRTTG